MKEIDKFSAQRGGHRTKWPPGSLHKRGSVSCVQTGCQDFCTHCVQNGCQNVVHTVQNGRQKVCTKMPVVRVKAPPPMLGCVQVRFRNQANARPMLVSLDTKPARGHSQPFVFDCAEQGTTGGEQVRFRFITRSRCKKRSVACYEPARYLR